MMHEGHTVDTEWGSGVVEAVTGRSVTILLDEGDFTNRINIAHGTPGYYRLVKANPHALDAVTHCR